MNEAPIPKKEVSSKPRRQPLNPETIRALQELGSVFREIHRELVAEGYIIRDGKIIKPGAADAQNGANS